MINHLRSFIRDIVILIAVKVADHGSRAVCGMYNLSSATVFEKLSSILPKSYRYTPEQLQMYGAGLT